MYKNSLNNFICHLSWLEKILPTHTHPFISIHKFLKPYKLLFFELESLVKCWIWLGKNSLNNFICHLSWLKKVSPTHTHPLVSIHKFMTPYQLLFFKLESLVKCWRWIGKKFTQILSLTCHGLRNFPLFIHIPSYPFMNF